MNQYEEEAEEMLAAPRPVKKPAIEDKLYNADPSCKHEIVDARGGGVKCSKCTGWFCL